MTTATAPRAWTALGQAIKPLGAVTIVAPDRNRSGASNSLTLDVPVRAARYDTDAYYVNGTPTDCVHLAISGLFDFEHDIVVSGVNDGANLGDDTLVLRHGGRRRRGPLSRVCRRSRYRCASSRTARAILRAPREVAAQLGRSEWRQDRCKAGEARSFSMSMCRICRTGNCAASR